MKKHNIMIPKPRSNFVKIECERLPKSNDFIYIQYKNNIMQIM